MNTTLYNGLPDPELDAQFYEGVPLKRLFAWIIDTLIILLLAVLLSLLSIGAFFFIFAFVVLVCGFLYRAATLASRSATWGMRIMAIEIRNAQGNRLTGSEALWHTLAYHLLFVIPFGILISAVLMLVNVRGKGLHDLFIGSTAINRPADL